MAHALAKKTDGEIAMAYVGPRPWHGLGVEFPAGTDAATILEAAGYTFDVKKRKLYFLTSKDGQHIEYPDRVALVPSDDAENPFAIASSDYKIFQPKDAIAFFKDICDNHGFSMNTAGFLHGRRVAWAQADVGEAFPVADKADMCRGKLLCSTSFDGTMPTSFRFVFERVVCANTLGVAMGERGGTVAKVRHKSVFSPEDMKARLGIGTVQAEFARTLESFRKLAATAWSPSAMLYNTFELLQPGKISTMDPDKVYKISNDDRSPISHILRLCVNDATFIGADMTGARETAWRWFNAVTQYVDHGSRARTADTRIDSAWFGQGAELKVKALELALASADATPVPLAITSEVASAGGVSGKDWIASLKAGVPPAATPSTGSDDADF